ncbi:hypothetical protein Aduo_000689 [Ancylostoma duodenale]
MVKFYIIAFAVTSLLPTLCNGLPFCSWGKLERSQINEYVLNPVNEARRILATGKQKNGYGGENLPATKRMTKLLGSCRLENKDIRTSSGWCMFKEDPIDGDRWATLFQQGYGFGDPIDARIIKTIFQKDLNAINIFPLEGVTPRRVVYKENTPPVLQNYVNIIRSNVTRIGCAFLKCNEPQDPYAVYCVTYSKKLNDGDVIYEA